MAFDAAAILEIQRWNARQERCRDAYHNGTRCDVCGHRSRSNRQTCDACRAAAARARKQAES